MFFYIGPIIFMALCEFKNWFISQTEEEFCMAKYRGSLGHVSVARIKTMPKFK